MALIKKYEQDGKKYLSLGSIKLRYSKKQKGCKCTVKIGIFALNYWVWPGTDGYFVKLFGGMIWLPDWNSFRRLKNYALRGKLTDEYCKNWLKQLASERLGYTPDIDNPKTFNEVILWLKFNCRNPLVALCCDKYRLKEYAGKLIGEHRIIPTIAQWEDPKAVDINSLPEKFVLKVNWSSGYNIVVKDKSCLNYREVKALLRHWVSAPSNSYYVSFNWGYKSMKPVIYAEKYIEQNNGQLYDYKFFFSHGEFICMFIAMNRNEDGIESLTYFDKDFNKIPLRRGNKCNDNPGMPVNLTEMIECGKKLAQPFPFVRVDYYETGPDEFYLGEMTFYTAGGLVPFVPSEWDWIIGDWIITEKWQKGVNNE